MAGYISNTTDRAQLRKDLPQCINDNAVNVAVLAAGGVVLGPVDIAGMPNVSFVATNTSAGGGGSLHTYTYQGSPDGTLWVDLANDAGVGPAAVADATSVPCPYRYVRVSAQETALAGPTQATVWITAQP